MPDSPIQVRFTRRGDEWHVSLEAEPRLWACGPTLQTALGRFVFDHAEQLGLQLLGIGHTTETHPLFAAEQEKGTESDGNA